ncbi:hypothetical protein Plhal703r1_c01g0002051 [Plasmopara halstedii]
MLDNLMYFVGHSTIAHQATKRVATAGTSSHDFELVIAPERYQQSPEEALSIFSIRNVWGPVPLKAGTFFSWMRVVEITICSAMFQTNQQRKKLDFFWQRSRTREQLYVQHLVDEAP